jgi:hypothetical protein
MAMLNTKVTTADVMTDPRCVLRHERDVLEHFDRELDAERLQPIAAARTDAGGAESSADLPVAP